MPGNRAATNLPWIICNDELEGEIAVGGLIVQAKAGGTLLIGDAVFISAAGTVNKSTVAADHTKQCGLVVGGQRYGHRQIVQRQLDVGLQAALVNEFVYVCIKGLAWGVAQAAIATAGVPVKPDVTTAGRLLTATLGAGADEGKLLGKAWQTAAGAASVFLVLVGAEV